MNRRLKLACVLLAVAALLASCGEDSGTSPEDTTPPTVTQMSPADGATDVGLITYLEMTFSEPMDPATITPSTFGVTDRSMPGFVEYDEEKRTASFIPDTFYAANTGYRLTVSGDIADEAGNTLGSPDTVEFQTGPFDVDHLDDYFEPNEETAEAVEVEVSHRYRSLTLNTGDDDDFFAVTVDDTVKLRLHTMIKASELSYSFWFYYKRDDGKSYTMRYLGNPSPGDSVAGLHYTFLPGTYYIAFSASSLEAGHLLYDFALTEEDPCQDDQYEDNDFRDEAVEVSTGYLYGRACCDDMDYFSMHLEDGEAITLTLTATAGLSEHGSGIFIQDIYGEGQVLVIDYTDPKSCSYTATESGTHTFCVWFLDDGISYELHIDVS